MLTPKQLRFVEEYPIDLNATQAASRAGYSARTINKQGPRLLKNDEVRSAIERALQERSRRTNIKSNDVLMEIARIALHRITVGLGRSFAPSIKMQSKQKALDQLARHLGPYSDQVQKLCLDYLAASLAKASAPAGGPQINAFAAATEFPVQSETAQRTIQSISDGRTYDWNNEIAPPQKQHFLECDYDPLDD